MSRPKEDSMFDAGIKGWIFNYARKNYWRVAAHYSFDDLVQDGYMWFWICKRRYCDRRPNAVLDTEHLFSLVKRCYANHITDLANKRSKGVEICISQMVTQPGTEDRAWDRLRGSEEAEGPVFAALAGASAEARKAVRLLCSEEGRTKLREPYAKKASGVRETTNEHLCRLLGMDPKSVDIATELRGLLST